MPLTRAQLDAVRGTGLAETVAPGTRLLFVGVNPGLRSAAVQAPFALRSNRFWPALFRSGILDRDIVTTNGWRSEDRAHLLARGIGITSLVAGATARAAELTAAELIAGAEAFTARMARQPPRTIAMLGVTAYRIAFRRPRAVLGEQPDRIADVPVWIVPNPSGLNAHATLASITAAYREVAIAAGIDVLEPQVGGVNLDAAGENAGAAGG